jgi:DNA-binding response OmpR family regulator
VLVVEDDRAARRAICQILTRLGFAPREAGTIADANRALDERPPTWVLLDLMLPDGSGVDILRRVRSEHPDSRVCVITGCGPSTLEAVRSLGAEHVLTKPLDVARLVSVLTPAATPPR